MNIGDNVRINGYVVVARALGLRGNTELVVVHNESSHYALLRREGVFQEDVEKAIPPEAEGKLLWSREYYDNIDAGPTWERVFIEALTRMTQACLR